jgi:hypothetical protein
MSDISRRKWMAMAGVTGIAMTGRVAMGSSTEIDAPADGNSGQPARSFARNVLEFAAKGDGKTDDTAAFQKALDAAHAAGGGVVHAPAGRYLIAGSLNVPEGAVLQGIFHGPTSHANFRDGVAIPPPTADGTMLLATGGRGKEDGTPLITQEANTTVAGLTIFYPDQNWETTPVEYPWTIRMHGNNCTVDNVELVNSWRGIKAVLASRHLIRNVTGQPLRVGIFVDEIYDIGRIENVHFYPWWKGIPVMHKFMHQYGESFIFGRTDWEYVLNTFSIDYHIAYHFIEGKTGACNGNFLGIGADGSQYAFVIESVQQPGLLITNGEFVSLDAAEWATEGLSKPTGAGDGSIEDGPIQVLVKERMNGRVWNRGPVRFVNCSFWGPCRQIARLESDTTLGFGDCTFCQWDKANPAIAALAGDLSVNFCDFRQTGQQVYLGPQVNQAVIAGNMARGKWNIVNDATGGDVQNGLNSSSMRESDAIDLREHDVPH